MPSPAPAASKTLILHIGDYKSGSTSLQMALAQNRITLAGRSLCYPTGLNHNALNPMLTGLEKPAAHPQRQKAEAYFETLTAEIKTADADITILSAETLEGRDPAVLQAMINRFFAPLAQDIRVVAYVRPHAGRILSSYVERIKVGAPQTLAQTLETFANQRMQQGGFVYHPRFSALRAQFGDRFLLRPAIRSQLHQGDVVADFFHYCFPDLDAQIQGDIQANASLCLEDLMRLKVLHNHLPQKPKPRHTLGWELHRILDHFPPAPARDKLQIHQSLAQQLIAHYQADARALDQSFFADQPLLASDLETTLNKAPDAAQSTRPADHFNARELRSLRMMATLCSNLLDQAKPGWQTNMHSWRLDAEHPAQTHHATSSLSQDTQAKRA